MANDGRPRKRKSFNFKNARPGANSKGTLGGWAAAESLWVGRGRTQGSCSGHEQCRRHGGMRTPTGKCNRAA